MPSASLQARAATPSGLSPLRGLRASMASTIAGALLLAGCHEAFEADPIQYHTVAGYAAMNFGHASILARRTLKDGLLSNAEYDMVMDAADAQREAEYRLTRDRIIADRAP